MDNPKNRQNDHLGVNKMGRNIRKSPLHQPNFANNPSNNNNAARQQPQPQVYNISKNDFRNIVQQLTGSPSHNDPLPRPPQNLPKPQNTRLQKIRPPPLMPMNRPRVAPPAPVPAAQPLVPYNNTFARPPQYGQPQPMPPPMALQPRDPHMNSTTESPISAYMRYLQTSMMDPGPRGNQGPPQPQGMVPAPVNTFPLSPGLLPSPNASMPAILGFPSPHLNSPALFPSPTSQFLLPSPSGFLNLPSPHSFSPLLSPRLQFPPPLTPNFSFSPATQSGILGPAPQPPPSPGLAFPLSPSGFFALPSPRWRGQ